MLQRDPEFVRFLSAQRHAIEKSLYLESEKEKRDLSLDSQGQPTNRYLVEWINKHAVSFRKAWNESVCKNCKNVDNCYDCLKKTCIFFSSVN